MHLDVITPTKKLLSEDIDEVVVMTPNGEIGILPHHENYVSQVVPGEMMVKMKGKMHYFAITGGFLEVANNKVTILSDYAVHSEDIDVKKAMDAKKRAEELLKRKGEGLTEQEYALASSELQRAISELHVANKRRRIRPMPQS
jgi:F-type H+-transporting ATPase subunit epsilon